MLAKERIDRSAARAFAACEMGAPRGADLDRSVRASLGEIVRQQDVGSLSAMGNPAPRREDDQQVLRGLADIGIGPAAGLVAIAGCCPGGLSAHRPLLKDLC
jgi:hypothetical protein